MRKKYFFLLAFLCLQVAMYGQNHTHVYSKVIGGNAWAFPVSELTNFTSCQSAASLTVNGFNWAGWDVTYNVEVNGNIIATGLDGQFTYDLSAYLPVNTVRMLATSGDGWITMEATLTVTSAIDGMPVEPMASNVTVDYGSTPTFPAMLTGTGTTLKWYTLQNGDVASASPATNAAGIATYWVSQANSSGCESARVPVQVTVNAPENIAHLIDSQCGIVLDNVNSYVYSNLVAGAQAYRFRVTDVSTGEVLTKDYSLRNLMLSSMPFYKYNNQYRVEVAVKRSNAWSGFGLPCDVWTPMPFTKVKDSQCGTIVAKNDMIYADIVSLAKGYMFYVINMENGFDQTIESTTRAFSFSKIWNFMPGTAYSIQVAVKNADGNYLPFGPECFVTTAGASGNGELFKQAVAGKEANEDVQAAFKVTAFPNPFAQDFQLAVENAGMSDIDVKIYDMFGRLVESKIMAATEIGNSVLGASISASGIYNVVVTQGGNTQALRMIKR